MRSTGILPNKGVLHRQRGVFTKIEKTSNGLHLQISMRYHTQEVLGVNLCLLSFKDYILKEILKILEQTRVNAFFKSFNSQSFKWERMETIIYNTMQNSVPGGQNFTLFLSWL